MESGETDYEMAKEETTIIKRYFQEKDRRTIENCKNVACLIETEKITETKCSGYD